jgi:hypothetical protein
MGSTRPSKSVGTFPLSAVSSVSFRHDGFTSLDSRVVGCSGQSDHLVAAGNKGANQGHALPSRDAEFNLGTQEGAFTGSSQSTL